MKNKQFTEFLVRQALIAAIYVALTFSLAALAYLPTQFRYSEMMVLMAFYDRKNIVGLTLGCAIANLGSPFGIIDIVIGTLGTFIATILISKSKNLYIASIWPTLVCILYGLQVMILSDTPVNFFLITGQFMLSEFVVVSLLGVPLFKLLQKNPRVMEVIVQKDQHTRLVG